MQQNHQLSVPQKAKAVLFREKWRHTLKPQMLVNLRDGQIICLAFANGKKHDFRLFKESHVHVLPNTLLEGDTGDLGLTTLHTNSSLPNKRSKNHPLTKRETARQDGVKRL